MRDASRGAGRGLDRGRRAFRASPEPALEQSSRYAPFPPPAGRSFGHVHNDQQRRLVGVVVTNVDDLEGAAAEMDRVAGSPIGTAARRVGGSAGVPSGCVSLNRNTRLSLRGVGLGEALVKAELVGQTDLSVTANTYSHVMLDESEVEYDALLSG